MEFIKHKTHSGFNCAFDKSIKAGFRVSDIFESENNVLSFRIYDNEGRTTLEFHRFNPIKPIHLYCIVDNNE